MIEISRPLYVANKTENYPEDYISSAPTVTKIKCGTTGAPGVGNSIKNPGVHKSKFSNIFPAIIKILKKEIKISVAALENDSFYVEINDISVIVSEQELSSSEQLSRMEVLVAAFIAAYCTTNKEFEEFRDVTKRIIDSIRSSGKAKYEDVLLMCDSFYYTCRNNVPKDAATGGFGFHEGESLTEESLRELERFSLPKIIEGFWENVSFSHINFTEKRSKKTVATSNDIISRCKSGEFILPYEWEDDDKKLIHPLSELDLYIPSVDFEDALLTMFRSASKIIQNMDMGKTGEEVIGNYGKCFAFIGKPGTGKTSMCKALCTALGIPYYPCTTTRYSEEDEYQGKLKISSSGENTAAYSSTTSNFRFCETPFLKGFEHGGMVVLEEFNLADPGMLMGAIGQAIEKPFIIEKDGYLPTKRHPLCIICVTCNIGTQGSQMPSEALFSRTPHVFEIDDPADDQFVKILAKQTEDVTEGQIKSVYQTYRKVLDWLKNENLSDLIKVLTLRHCLAALDQIAAGVSTKKALIRTMVNPLKVYAPEVAEDVKVGIIDIIK